MNYFEYSKVKKVLQSLEERGISEEEIRFWSYAPVYYSGCGVVKCEGRFSLELQDFLEKKFFDGLFGILKDKCESTPYNTVYKIMTKEGLLLFLLEIQDYFARKYGKKEMGMVLFSELYVQLNEELIKEGHFQFTTADWFIQKGIFLVNDFENDDLRKMTQEFDSLVNPYMSKEIELCPVKDYLEKVNLSVYKEKEVDGVDTRLEIMDRKTENITSYSRSSKKLSYFMRCHLGNFSFMSVAHTFFKEEKMREVIEIHYWGLEESETYFYEFGTNDLEMQALIQEHLRKAISFGKNITLGSMVENESSYKRELKK